MKRIGIMTGGGDCAGLNAVIASVVKAGIPMGYEFIGFEKGWEGILSPMMFRELSADSVRGISHLGGTILHTTNRGRFGAKVGEGENQRIPDEILSEAANNLASVNCVGLIVIGGDGTLSGALQLSEKGVKVVGVPKTIDNDLHATDRTFGFSTAVQVVVDGMDRIHTTASSHDRVIFVESMGRHTGWIALRAGLAGGADAVLLPEFPFEIADFVEFLQERKRHRVTSAVVVVAEGAKVEQKRAGAKERQGMEVLFGGVSHRVMELVEQLAPGEFEMRATIFGHMQRGGTPNAEDRVLAKEYGVAAMELYHAGEFNKMVCFVNHEMSSVPIVQAVNQLKQVTSQTLQYRALRKLGVFIH